MLMEIVVHTQVSYNFIIMKNKNIIRIAITIQSIFTPSPQK